MGLAQPAQLRRAAPGLWKLTRPDRRGSWSASPPRPAIRIELGDRFLEGVLPDLLEEFNDAERPGTEPVPWLAALVCASAFDLAVHDAYGVLHGLPTYETYNARFMNADLDDYLEAAEGSDVSFAGRYPEDFLVRPRPQSLPAWHLVGGKDPIDPSELTGAEPDDGYPVLLARLDPPRRAEVPEDQAPRRRRRLGLRPAGQGRHARRRRRRRLAHCRLQLHGARALPTSTAILDRLMREQPRLYGMMLYVEQPFPYDLEAHRIDVHWVSSRKPLFMDESAHDWRLVRLGRSLGWTRRGASRPARPRPGPSCPSAGPRPTA